MATGKKMTSTQIKRGHLKKKKKTYKNDKYIPFHGFGGQIFLQVFDRQGIGFRAVVRLLVICVVKQRPGPGAHIVRRQHPTQLRRQNLRQDQLVQAVQIVSMHENLNIQQRKYCHLPGYVFILTVSCSFYCLSVSGLHSLLWHYTVHFVTLGCCMYMKSLYILMFT